MEENNKYLFIVKADKDHGFESFSDARKWAKKHITGTVNQLEIGEINISNTAIDKYLSKKAVEKSASKDIHLSALRILPDIIKNSFVGNIHADKNNNDNIKDIVRLFSAIEISDKTYCVKTKAYSYEVTEIELLNGSHGNDLASPLPRTFNNSISDCKDTNFF
jgi:hypothetical protein